jgi:hypothetical protein
VTFPSTKTIYKICDAAAWQAAERAGKFAGAPVDLADGYIHFSAADQVAETRLGRPTRVSRVADRGALRDPLAGDSYSTNTRMAMFSAFENKQARVNRALNFHCALHGLKAGVPHVSSHPVVRDRRFARLNRRPTAIQFGNFIQVNRVRCRRLRFLGHSLIS